MGLLQCGGSGLHAIFKPIQMLTLLSEFCFQFLLYTAKGFFVSSPLTPIYPHISNPKRSRAVGAYQFQLLLLTDIKVLCGLLSLGERISIIPSQLVSPRSIVAGREERGRGKGDNTQRLDLRDEKSPSLLLLRCWCRIVDSSLVQGCSRYGLSGQWLSAA